LAGGVTVFFRKLAEGPMAEEDHALRIVQAPVDKSNTGPERGDDTRARILLRVVQETLLGIGSRAAILVTVPEALPMARLPKRMCPDRAAS
jgi:hypothetical protein